MATAPGTAGRTHRLQGFRCRTRPAAGSRRGVTAAAYALLSLFLHMMLRLGSLPFARLCVAREREAFAYLPRFHPSNDLSTLLPAQAPEPDSSTASSSRAPTSPSESKRWATASPSTRIPSWRRPRTAPTCTCCTPNVEHAGADIITSDADFYWMHFKLTDARVLPDDAGLPQDDHCLLLPDERTPPASTTPCD